MAVPVYRSGNTGTGVASCVINKPAGVLPGDVMLAWVGVDSGAVTPPTGWYREAVQVGAGINLSMFSRRVDGTEGASFTFTGGSTVTEGVINAWSGNNLTTYMDALPTTGTATSATPTWSNMTSVTENVMHVCMSADTVGAQTNPAGYTARQASVTYIKTCEKSFVAAQTITGPTSTGGATWITGGALIRSETYGSEFKKFPKNPIRARALGTI